MIAVYFSTESLAVKWSIQRHGVFRWLFRLSHFAPLRRYVPVESQRDIRINQTGQIVVQLTTSWIKLVISNRRLLRWDIDSLIFVAWFSYILSSGWNVWPKWVPSHRAHLWQIHFLQVPQNTESFSLCSSHLSKRKELLKIKWVME